MRRSNVPSGCKRVLRGMVTISAAPALSLHEPLRSQVVGLAGLGLNLDFLPAIAHFERFGLARRDGGLHKFAVLPVEGHLETAAGHQAASRATWKPPRATRPLTLPVASAVGRAGRRWRKEIE